MKNATKLSRIAASVTLSIFGLAVPGLALAGSGSAANADAGDRRTAITFVEGSAEVVQVGPVALIVRPNKAAPRSFPEETVDASLFRAAVTGRRSVVCDAVGESCRIER